LCLITNDSFRTLTTYASLRRWILDRCKIVEILLTDTKHFEGVSFQFAGMAVTTLEKCSDAEARAANARRLVDYVREPADFADPSAENVQELRQEEYEALEETPFFVRRSARGVRVGEGLRHRARRSAGEARAGDGGRHEVPRQRG
jgi:hypothetical protein